jgi:transposase
MKNDARRLAPEAQEALRRRAVAVVLAREMTQAAASTAFGVARKTVWLWLEAHRQGGEAALAARKRGPKGGHGKLKGWQAATV